VIPAGITIDNTRRAVTARLKAAGIDTPDLDARLLIGHVLGLDLTAMIVQASRLLTPDDAAQLEKVVLRRLVNEPVARIIGMKEFWGLSLRLSPDALVPRPDTETIVETALGLIDPTQPLYIIDLGTGSGAILLALLSECPKAFGVGTDISIDALNTARANARDLGFADRSGFVACDYASAMTGSFDLIVSNPPYIRSADIARLDKDVRDHDPMRALDGGIDGLDGYRMIARQSASLLKRGGLVVLETGHDQSDDVQMILDAAGLPQATAPGRDLAGIPRAVSARKG
jgi:release factor glutamine methyltransferase